jgi:hypothetical protein
MTNNKKNNKSNSKTVKKATSTKVKKATSTAKKSADGSRKSAAEVQQVIFGAMCELHCVGIQEIPVELIAMFAGYSNTRSATFAKQLKDLESKAWIGKPKTAHFSLTEVGIKEMPPVDPPKSNEDVHERLLGILQKKVKTTDKLMSLWDLLRDGKEHDIKALAGKIGYGNSRSAGYASMISTMQELGLAEKTKGSVRLTDVAFPFGRPAP